MTNTADGKDGATGEAVSAVSDVETGEETMTHSFSNFFTDSLLWSDAEPRETGRTFDGGEVAEADVDASVVTDTAEVVVAIAVVVVEAGAANAMEF